MYLESFAGMLWFHTDVYKWSSKVKTKYLEDLNLLQNLVNTPLVSLVEEDNKKLAKFAEIIGMKMVDKMNLTNGDVGYVYARGL